MDRLVSQEKAVASLCEQFNAYAGARVAFLRHLNRDRSCRDPLAEFSEIIVEQLLEGRCADSPVQKGYDLIWREKRRVQVKCLANPGGEWVNGHTIEFRDKVDDYALAVFIGFEIKSVLVFHREKIHEVCERLRKKHKSKLDLTMRNYETILKDATEYMAGRLLNVYQF